MLDAMDPATRKRLLTDLSRLPRSEFEDLIREARAAENTEEAAVRALRQAFARTGAAGYLAPEE
jgi:hypothetical protein